MDSSAVELALQPGVVQEKVQADPVLGSGCEAGGEQGATGRGEREGGQGRAVGSTANINLTHHRKLKIANSKPDAIKMLL